MISWTRRPRHLAWGRIPTEPHMAASPRFLDEVGPALRCADQFRRGALPIGAARSYGESALNPGGGLIEMAGLDRFISFDPELGVLRAEAGQTLDKLLSLVVPAGWFVRTSPGTRFVTLGGAVANDVHGKNHHRAGAFGMGVRRICLMRSDASAPVEVSPGENAELFAATVGGLGLTGTMLWVELQLERTPSSFMIQETLPFGSVAEFLAIAAESAHTHEWTAAWVDCGPSPGEVGRGFFYRANWSQDEPFQVHPKRARLSAPITPPASLVRPATVAAFNRAYRMAHRMKRRVGRVHYDAVLYPLDAVGGWNRVYGPGGFRQYQFVVPLASAEGALCEALKIIAKSGEGSFLSVLKTFGPLRSPGLLSFPMEGVTLAIDFRNRGQATLELFSRLDAIVAAAGGRLYPAKDGRMPLEMFRAGYPAWAAWASWRDPALQSEFAHRMLP